MSQPRRSAVVTRGSARAPPPRCAGASHRKVAGWHQPWHRVSRSAPALRVANRGEPTHKDLGARE